MQSRLRIIIYAMAGAFSLFNAVTSVMENGWGNPKWITALCIAGVFLLMPTFTEEQSRSPRAAFTRPNGIAAMVLLIVALGTIALRYAS